LKTSQAKHIINISVQHAKPNSRKFSHTHIITKPHKNGEIKQAQLPNSCTELHTECKAWIEEKCKTYASADSWTSSAAEKKASFCHRSKLFATIIFFTSNSTKKQKQFQILSTTNKKTRNQQICFVFSFLFLLGQIMLSFRFLSLFWLLSSLPC